MQTEGSGLLFLFASCAAFIAVGFFAKPALFPSAPLGRFSLRTFAVAWLLAVTMNLALTAVRTKQDVIGTPWDLAIAAISWTVVTLIFSVPALIALVLLRITRPAPS